MNRKLLVAVVLFSSLSAVAEGRWTFSAGPAWRSRVKMETHGTAYGNPQSDSVVDSRVRDYGSIEEFNARQQDSANWNLSTTADPKAGTTAPADSKVWQTTAERQTITVTGGDAYHAVYDTDTEAPLGLNLQAGYDFYQAETWSVGLGIRFAGYWNMRSSASGALGSSTVRTRTYADSYRFLNDLYLTGDPAMDLDSAASRPEATPSGSQSVGDVTYLVGDGRVFSTRLRSDLYQIGLGPKVTWTPFAGVCDCMSWLDVYGGVEVLCNIAYTRFDADGSSTSSAECLIGFGGNMGLVGNITDWLGIYGQVGYEWIDKSDVSAGSFRSEIDYSSLVVSAGVQIRF